jgi:fructose-bisphosphate aldolase class II
MPLATPAQYAEILDAAKAGGYAIPAVNVSSSTTLNAAILGFVTAGSDGIVQVSRGGGDFAADPSKDRPLGVRALADYAAAVGEQVRRLIPRGTWPSVLSVFIGARARLAWQPVR